MKSILARPFPQKSIDRFWSKVDHRAPDECWEWQGYRHPLGYGRVTIGGRGDTTHRVAYRIAMGPIPDGLHVRHTCDNPPCCNPAHLILGTPQDNMNDRDSRGRHGRWTNPDAFPKGEQAAHAKLTDEDVIDIRRRVAAGESQRALAREYGVSNPLINHIVKRRQWRHIT